MRFIRFIITLVHLSIPVLMLLPVSCQAPRDNPFDPASPAYVPEGPPERINDLVLDDLIGLQCKLVWTSPERAVRYELYSGTSDWDGITLAEADKYQGELPGVTPAGTLQSVWINLSPGQKRRWALFSYSESGIMSEPSNPVMINAPERDRPAEINISFRSVHRASWESLPYMALEIDATINDSDGVVQVWLEHSSVAIGFLQSTGDNINWFGRFTESQLPGLGLGDLVGHPLVLVHRDNARFESETEPFYIIRVIYDTPQVDFPDNDTLLYTDQPCLGWIPFEAEYNFTYSIEVLHIPEGASVGTIIYTAEGIPSNSTSHLVTTALTSEPQFLVWTVAVIDEFNNEARSKTARFRIDGDE